MEENSSGLGLLEESSILAVGLDSRGERTPVAVLVLDDHVVLLGPGRVVADHV